MGTRRNFKAVMESGRDREEITVAREQIERVDLDSQSYSERSVTYVLWNPIFGRLSVTSTSSFSRIGNVLMLDLSERNILSQTGKRNPLFRDHRPFNVYRDAFFPSAKT